MENDLIVEFVLLKNMLQFHLKILKKNLTMKQRI